MSSRSSTLVNLFGKIFAKVTRTVHHVVCTRILRPPALRYGKGVRIIGRPIISAYEGSTISIGDRVVLCSDSRYTALGVAKPVIIRTLAVGASIEIANDVGLSGTVICAARSIKIGPNCLVGADVTIVDTDFHPVSPASGRRYAPIPMPQETDGVTIGADVFLGSGAMILKGVSIGQGSMIAARSVVTNDIPPYTIAAGTPARPIGSVRK